MIKFDFSHGSNNPYTINPIRHNLIPSCMVCGKGSTVTLDGAEYFNYFVKGLNISLAFPTLSPSQREVLITGTHPDCWDELFDHEDEDDD